MKSAYEKHRNGISLLLSQIPVAILAGGGGFALADGNSECNLPA